MREVQPPLCTLDVRIRNDPAHVRRLIPVIAVGSQPCSIAAGPIAKRQVEHRGPWPADGNSGIDEGRPRGHRGHALPRFRQAVESRRRLGPERTDDKP